MKVRITLEITDSQRGALSRSIKPRAKKRLAKRAEVVSFLEGCIAALDLPEQSDQRPRVINGIDQLVQQLKEKDPDFCRNKSPSYLRGAAKVHFGLSAS